MIDSSTLPQQVRVCQHQSCRKSGAVKVLNAFRSLHLLNWEIVGSHCLGECGNGPMVLILPEQIWYGRVHPDEVPAIADRHLRGGKPVQAMLYRKFHPNP